MTQREKELTALIKRYEKLVDLETKVSPDKPKVSVLVEGGIVQSVYSNKPIDVSILDLDNVDNYSNEEKEKMLNSEIEGLEPIF